MKVLLAAKYVPSGVRPIGGVQSWNATVRAELERLGHEVSEFEPGMTVNGRFDLGIFANGKLTRSAMGACGRVVNISHGIISAERPWMTDALFVSEGVRAHWGGKGGIIRQPIDLEFWKPARKQRSGVVRFSYRQSPTLCEAVAAELGQDYRQVHDATADEARDILTEAALVFASGRAALEAMACGAPTVIYDHRSTYQGPLMATDLGQQMANSYSGRGGFEPTVDDLLSAAENARSQRKWVQRHHDVRDIVAGLLA